ncbi:5'-methylthioadenosine/S-adenosylhomocysteine nucleosidase [Crassaminicella profunda]|uniref:5'-methylthioadenosine/S-adenosylhomocysteine nucleosidase family protein n=1 Tax=Crassaminicella profunda TaxID=1286698 RepID=UPI001CA704CB|nr:5'-methylthioadenosine/S-adenosylhomocysteine nucleosidase [Crassaminicella profunda]QZY56412.1 5'-methylthioadenosine/S-adenosylhomocysteine nucleosidase [Crassaminicella profunda]
MDGRVVVIISARTEWKIICEIFKNVHLQDSPYGKWFQTEMAIGEDIEPIIFFHGGWGKISAAASTQYVIDQWQPDSIINMGTCGGFEGLVERGTTVLVDRTIVYDIIEEMDDAFEAIEHFSTDIDLSWMQGEYPQKVKRTSIATADRDLQPNEVEDLNKKFGVIVGDWESGAIAWVAKRNNKRLLILRGVSDLVGKSGGEAYEQTGVFEANARKVMKELVSYLPDWIYISIA